MFSIDSKVFFTFTNEEGIIPRHALSVKSIELGYLILNVKDQIFQQVILSPLNEYLTDTENQKAGSSGISFAANLLENLFCTDELHGCNVCRKGKKDLAKRPLNVQKVEYIQYLSECIFNHSRKKDFWKNCTNHMNKRIHKLLMTEEEDKDITL
ncbi:hypothetical protein BpHYR1_031879 [Brachionus plicatilis]|uniref:BEN domain-containing protein n=1 Tax=Brachionus plicatilis TaxID=10195 RepID=A0A3M7P8Z2_BRAPC|nr:hypothetical protein BpHYR1_031879 [Brachionus plicatilis]